MPVKSNSVSPMGTNLLVVKSRHVPEEKYVLVINRSAELWQWLPTEYTLKELRDYALKQKMQVKKNPKISVEFE